MNLSAISDQVVELSESVGSFIKEQRISASDIETKSLNNLVSFVDKTAEEKFIRGLSEILPGSGFIAEEGTAAESEHDSEHVWIIDPLDGTTNFIHRIPAYCTSVALMSSNELVLGVIHDPSRNETFHAIKDGGSYLNGTPISVSETAILSSSLLATGFPYDDFGHMDNYMELLKDFCRTTRGLRRIGSAAIDLAWTACGRFDGFYEYGLNPWDVAAGIIIVREAGGKVSEFNDGKDPLFGESILADNALLHIDLLDSISRHFC